MVATRISECVASDGITPKYVCMSQPMWIRLAAEIKVRDHFSLVAGDSLSILFGSVQGMVIDDFGDEVICGY